MEQVIVDTTEHRASPIVAPFDASLLESEWTKLWMGKHVKAERRVAQSKLVTIVGKTISWV